MHISKIQISRRGLFIPVLLWCCLPGLHAQYNRFECPQYNAFARSAEQVASLETLVHQVNPDGAIDLNPDFADSLEALPGKMSETGTSFQLLRTISDYTDRDVFYRQYQQYYNGLKVEGGGYTVAFRGPNTPPPDPCAGAFLLQPYILSGLEGADNPPDISVSELVDLTGAEVLLSNELLITHAVQGDCAFTLAWKTIYQKDGLKAAWIDAHSGQVLRTMDIRQAHNAPTVTYGNQFLNDLTFNGYTTLQSPDANLIVRDFGYTCPDPAFVKNEWLTATIPSTTHPDTWTNESTAEVYQSFWVVSEILQHYQSIGIDFDKVNVGVCEEEQETYALAGSNIKDTYVSISKAGGVTMALYDVMAHELAHSYLNGFFDYTASEETAALHEGVSDILGAYLEFLQQGTIDWVGGDDEPVVAGITGRNLSAPGCFASPGLERYGYGQVLGYWYYLLSTGNASAGIDKLGPEKALKILLKGVQSGLPTNADIPTLLRQIVQQVKTQYGRCSKEFLAVSNACERICVSTGYAGANGQVAGCDISICENIQQVCEESEELTLCACGDFVADSSRFVWTILGKKSTSFQSELGMNGNKQIGGNCLHLTDFPKYSYYPQTITIELYDAYLGQQSAANGAIVRKTIKLIDCNHDDPACDDYALPPGDTDDRTLVSDETDHPPARIQVYDMLGRLYYEGTPDDFQPYRQMPHFACYVLLAFDASGRMIRTQKVWAGQ